MALNCRDVFQGESSFYFVLECNLSFPGRSHQYVRKCNNRLDVNKITKTVLHFRTKWYCRIPLVRKCKDRLSINLIISNRYISEQVVLSVI